MARRFVTNHSTAGASICQNASFVSRCWARLAGALHRPFVPSISPKALGSQRHSRMLEHGSVEDGGVGSLFDWQPRQQIPAMGRWDEGRPDGCVRLAGQGRVYSCPQLRLGSRMVQGALPAQHDFLQQATPRLTVEPSSTKRIRQGAQR